VKYRKFIEDNLLIPDEILIGRIKNKSSDEVVILENYNFHRLDLTDKNISNLKFYNCSLRGAFLSNSVFIDCIFDNCHIGTRDDITKLSIFRNIDMTDCLLFNCLIGPVILEDITIKNLKTGDIAIFNLPLLKHIKIEGKIEF